MPSSPDVTFNQGHHQGASLANFLSRPLKINTTSWVVGANLDVVLNPWTLFFTNTAVAKRIDNYNLLRCKLMCKIVINGTPFHYGRALMSYQPWQTYNLLDPTVLSDYAMVGRSQRPHVFIDPSQSTGGCLCLPFFHLDNWIHVTDATAFSEMGEIRINSFDILRHANDGTESIDISLFVWAEDVELAGPTELLSAQGLVTKDDEYSANQGRISKPASNIAEWASVAAGWLAPIAPELAPFAMATSIAADAVAGIARLFGWSRPPILTQPMYMKRQVYGDLAVCDAPETLAKLTVDSKQELTIDPRTVGLSNDDEMKIQSFTAHESYVGQFLWTSVNNSEDLLQVIDVSPMGGLTDGAAFYYSPLAFASLPFHYWSGSLIFRFQVVASNFHRGRLRIVHDPNSSNIAGLSDTVNTNYNRIIDLSEERDFEIQISWAQACAYRLIASSGVYDIARKQSTVMAANNIFTNGALYVIVLNELNAPSDLADVKVNMFIRAGPDFELARPSNFNLDTISYFPPVVAEAQGGEEPLEPQGLETAIDDPLPNQPAENEPNSGVAKESIGEVDLGMSALKAKVFFGERYYSFRTLLKRYNFYVLRKYDQTSVSSTMGATEFIYPDYPLARGAATAGVHLQGGVTPFNYVGGCLISYLGPAFVARRGGIRYKYQKIGTGYISTIANNYGSAYSRSNFPIVGNTTSISSSARNALLATGSSLFEGAHSVDATVNPGLEVELPFYSPKRFAFTRDPNQYVNGKVRDETENFGHRVVTYNDESTSISSRTSLASYVSVAEDFQFFFFLNVPPIYYYGDIA